jgi:hypothetical protein
LKATTVWGWTCPFLKIARHFGVPYESVLYLADWYQHDRHPPAGCDTLMRDCCADEATFSLVNEAVLAVCAAMSMLRAGRGHL